MNYFVQTQPNANEGPMAEEVDQRDFTLAAFDDPLAQIEYDEDMDALYLRVDLLDSFGGSVPKHW